MVFLIYFKNAQDQEETVAKQPQIFIDEYH